MNSNPLIEPSLSSQSLLSLTDIEKILSNPIDYKTLADCFFAIREHEISLARQTEALLSQIDPVTDTAKVIMIMDKYNQLASLLDKFHMVATEKYLQLTPQDKEAFMVTYVADKSIAQLYEMFLLKNVLGRQKDLGVENKSEEIEKYLLSYKSDIFKLLSTEAGRKIITELMSKLGEKQIVINLSESASQTYMPEHKKLGTSTDLSDLSKGVDNVFIYIKKLEKKDLNDSKIMTIKSEPGSTLPLKYPFLKNKSHMFLKLGQKDDKLCLIIVPVITSLFHELRHMVRHFEGILLQNKDIKVPKLFELVYKNIEEFITIKYECILRKELGLTDRITHCGFEIKLDAQLNEMKEKLAKAVIQFDSLAKVLSNVDISTETLLALNKFKVVSSKLHDLDNGISYASPPLPPGIQGRIAAFDLKKDNIDDLLKIYPTLPNYLGFMMNSENISDLKELISIYQKGLAVHNLFESFLDNTRFNSKLLDSFTSLKNMEDLPIKIKEILYEPFMDNFSEDFKPALNKAIDEHLLTMEGRNVDKFMAIYKDLCIQQVQNEILHMHLIGGLELNSLLSLPTKHKGLGTTIDLTIEEKKEKYTEILKKQSAEEKPVEQPSSKKENDNSQHQRGHNPFHQ